MEVHGRSKRNFIKKRPIISDLEREIINSGYFFGYRKQMSSGIGHYFHFILLEDVSLKFDLKEGKMIPRDPELLMEKLNSLPVDIQNFFIFNLDLMR